MGFQLTIAEGREAGREFLFEQPSVVIGRSSECDVVLYDPGVSRKHARIFAEGSDFFVEDMGSSNGTKVNGQLVKRQQLADGDSVTLGPVVFNFIATVMEESTAEHSLDGGVANESTRIVSLDQVKKAKGKAAALAPTDAREEDLQQMGRSATRTMQAVSRPRATNSGASGALAKKREEAPAPPPARARPQPAGGGLSAAERARIRRESPGLLASIKIFWLEASPRTRQLFFAGAGVFGLAMIGLLYYLVLAPDDAKSDLPPEPSALTATRTTESFGLGDGVDYERSDMKAFDFEFTSPTQTLVILTYQARDISQGEVVVIVNGQEVDTVPPDTLASNDRMLEVVIKPNVLKKGEKNTLIFDNTKNPPGEESWRVWNLRVEPVPLPEVPIEQLLAEAKSSFDRGVRNMERKDVGAGNRYEAWKEYRNAWLLLEGHPEPKPELYELSRVKMREAQAELDRTCAKLMLEVETYNNQNNWDAARATLDHVNQYFPNPRDQLCPRRAEQKRLEYGL